MKLKVNQKRFDVTDDNYAKWYDELKVFCVDIQNRMFSDLLERYNQLQLSGKDKKFANQEKTVNAYHTLLQKTIKIEKGMKTKIVTK